MSVVMHNSIIVSYTDSCMYTDIIVAQRYVYMLDQCHWTSYSVAFPWGSLKGIATPRAAVVAS